MAKRRAMKRNSKGRFVKVAVNPPRRRRRTQRTAAAAPRRNAYFANPRRKRSVRRYRRNPPLFGGNKIMGLGLNEVLYAGAGFVAPPLIEGALSNFIPSTITANPIGKYIVKAGIVAGTSFLGGKFLGREAGKMLAIGGATFIAASLIVDYAPQIFSGFGATSYVPGKVFTPSLRGQSMLGAYMGAGNTPSSMVGIPSRLRPEERF